MELPETVTGKKAQIKIMVDADHAHFDVTRRSVSGILVFINSSPVRWYSKMQNTVETSTYYGSEICNSKDRLNTSVFKLGHHSRSTLSEYDPKRVL
jgi:hypothetical protein